MIKEKVLKYIEDRFSDISPRTVQIYKERFAGASDKEVIAYFKKYPLRLYVEDKDVTPSKLDKLINKMGVVTQEKIVLPYKGNATTASEVMIFPVQMRRLQQLATKQSHSKMEVVSRNKAGQASGVDKTGKLTDPEVTQLAALGLDRTLTELMVPRSGNTVAKRSMDDQIRKNLKFRLDSTEINLDDRPTLQYMDHLYKGINIATDLIDRIEDIS